MKNYIRDVIDRYINHDYPKEVDQDFRTWLTDEERADEKDHELNQLWEATESATTSGYRHSLERQGKAVYRSGGGTLYCGRHRPVCGTWHCAL